MDERARSRNALASRARAAAEVIADRLPASPDATRGLSGHAGAALLFAALARTTGKRRFLAEMHARLKEGARPAGGGEAGLYGGISGLRAAAAVAAAVEPRYSAFVAQCDAFLERHVRSAEAAPSSFAQYDVTSGWSGVRLARSVKSETLPADRCLELLAWIAADETRWRCVHPHRGGAPENDLGMAHGIAGVLGTIALTTDRARCAGELRNVVARGAWRLAGCVVDGGGGVPAWRASLQSHAAAPHLAAWCYGAPGVLAALLTTARWLCDRELEELALDGLLRVAGLAPEACGLQGFALCHGLLGNALIFASAGDACGSATLRGASDRLVERTLDGLEAGESAGTQSESCEVALALTTLCCGADPEWMRLRVLLPLGHARVERATCEEYLPC